jgi:serine/threonine-protein kinase
MKLMRALGKPMEIPQGRTGWLWNQLPQQELESLRHAGVEWLFPICVDEGQTETFLALGPKKSESPYSLEDQELLQGITSALALLLKESTAAVAAHDGFEECPECGTCYDSGSGRCRKEGTRLTPVMLPRLLGHRYRFEQRLGQGGMGMVYEAQDMELERRVAVKLMRPDLTANEEAAARFRREARAAAGFAHPNVVTVHDIGVAENRRAYLVMELLNGSTLREKIDRQGRVSPDRASGIMKDICNAVAAAHGRHILHRDLKPENIFLAHSEGGEIAKILDFGVAKFMAPLETDGISSHTRAGMIVGTLKYMSPEALRGESPAEGWDLWALAVVAYEMLSGVHPIAASTAAEARDAILAGHLTPLRDHMPEALPSWQLFFHKALAAGRESRPASASQLLSDFMEAIGRPSA